MTGLMFSTDCPERDVVRALDTIRKMGFEFLRLNVEPVGHCGFRVVIEFRQCGLLSSQTLFQRLAGLDGISAVCEATSSHVRSAAAAFDRAPGSSGRYMPLHECQVSQ